MNPFNNEGKRWLILKMRIELLMPVTAVNVNAVGQHTALIVVSIIIVEIYRYGNSGLVQLAGLLKGLSLLLGSDILLHLAHRGLRTLGHNGEDLQNKNQSNQDAEYYTDTDAGYLPSG